MRNRLLLLTVMIILPAAGCQEEEPLAPYGGWPPSGVLFIGNSYTSYNGGLDALVEGLVETGIPSHDIETGIVAPSGYTLSMHAESRETREAIADGDWDVVVIQEQSTTPLTNPEAMFNAAREIDRFIRESGAQTVLFMTWAREASPGTIEGIAAVYDSLGEELGAPVAPVGRAFSLALERRPDIGLYDPDGSHPDARGSYLAACLFYAFLWGEDPRGNVFTADLVLEPAERSFLQEIAWEVIDTKPGLFTQQRKSR